MQLHWKVLVASVLVALVTRQIIVRFPSGYSHSAFRPRNDSKVSSHGERLFYGKAHGQV
jgi:hypothetical protein